MEKRKIFHIVDLLYFLPFIFLLFAQDAIAEAPPKYKNFSEEMLQASSTIKKGGALELGDLDRLSALVKEVKRELRVRPPRSAYEEQMILAYKMMSNVHKRQGDLAIKLGEFEKVKPAMSKAFICSMFMAKIIFDEKLKKANRKDLIINIEDSACMKR